jgi:hypothetical protein
MRRGQPNQTGSGATDFGRWGGAMAFDTTGPSGARNWHFGIDTLPGPGQPDILSIATHEIAHALGFGTADSFNGKVSFISNEWVFTGAKSTEVYSANPPIDPASLSHWEEDTMSLFEGAPQDAMMVPGIMSGTRRGFTVLDYAAMMDIGWEVPESAFFIPVPGDADGDGDVDDDDINVIALNYGQATPNGAADGDHNDDGLTNLSDFSIAALNFGVGVSADVPAALPEPATALMLLTGFGLLSRRNAR